MVQPYDPASHRRGALPEEEVRRKHADEREVLLAAEAHDGQGCLHAQGEVLVLAALHAGDLLGVFGQVGQQLALPLTPSGDVLLQACGQLCGLEDAVCSRGKQLWVLRSVHHILHVLYVLHVRYHVLLCGVKLYCLHLQLPVCHNWVRVAKVY